MVGVLVKITAYYEAAFFFSSITALLVSILCFLRKSSYLLFSSFLILFLSDFIFIFNGEVFQYIQYHSLLLNLIFSFLLFLFSINLEKNEYTSFSYHDKNKLLHIFKRINFDISFRVMKIILFFIYIYTFYLLEIRNNFDHISQIGTLNFIYFTFSYIFESAYMAIIFPVSFLSRNWYSVLISNGLLIMNVSKFVTKYSSMFELKKNTNYEILLLIGIGFIGFSQFFYMKEIQEKIEQKWMNFISIRSIPSLCVLIISIPLSIFFLKLNNPTESSIFSNVNSNIFELSNLIDPIDSIVFLAISYVLLNILSNILSKKITQISDMIKIPNMNEYLDIYQNDKDVFLTIPENKMTLLEFKKFTLKYNELTNQSNSIMNKLVIETKKSSIANITQMLAHDVRKPFSMLELSLNMIKNANNFDEIKSLSDILIPEVNRALRSVNGLIQDVMEIGNNKSPKKECSNPIELIFESINQIFKIHYYANIKFFYDLKHTYFVDVESVKILRVISNIIENAIQSMKMTGDLFFSTVDFFDCDCMYVKFSIKNSGSYISNNDMPNLFEPYFTKNKKGGTGLGLAIVKKIIQDHNGNVWCISQKNEEHKDGFVDFIFTLPVNKKININKLIPLPSESKEIISIYEFKKTMNLKDENILENEIILDSIKWNSNFTILIIDDESIYCNNLADMINQNNTLKNKISIKIENTFYQALDNIFKNKYDLIILDIDLGLEEDGYELLRRLRNNKINSYICVHSNRAAEEDNRKSYDLGANLFMNKPMSRKDFLNLILKSIELKK